ncbi:4'-phosphopantetheinyl transferase [Campylobacter mucosalis]|uniref:holo-ACP synthase n=1 Tax=Campylobacter mucosalis TaxID=202 RepID=UPI0004D3AE62|nr:holo-ACP synthase [Campylobacter mucosalis]KEA46664.1 4'-phosphopantetheinyl transferase [Campylobacter mucosalis]QKF62813.1 holo-(acyl-carrier-protein) synthase [Campylobacter mucosalis]
MIGIDIVAIDRISRLKKRFGDSFLRRFLSDDEISLAKNDTTLAGFWAAKEAASKALGVGISKECGFDDIKISKNSKNAPMIDFSEHILKDFNIKNASLSITHDGGFAIAVVALSLKH